MGGLPVPGAARSRRYGRKHNHRRGDGWRPRVFRGTHHVSAAECYKPYNYGRRARGVGTTMNKIVLIGFPLLITIDTASQVFIKIIGNRVSQFEFGIAWALRILNEPLLFLVLLFFGAAFAVYLMLLKSAAVGPVYAAAHLNLVTVSIISVLYFGEHLSWVQALGAVIIVAGVAVLAATEVREERP